MSIQILAFEEQFPLGLFEDWRVELMTFVPNVLQTSSILHVAVLVYLRLLAILKPMSYKDVHEKVRKRSIPIIWVVSIASRLISVLTQIFEPMPKPFYAAYRYIALHVFHTVPIIFIICMYVKLVWTLKKISEESNTTQATFTNVRNPKKSISKKATLLVQRVVLFLLGCYLPFLAWEQYWEIITFERIPFISGGSDEVIANKNMINA